MSFRSGVERELLMWESRSSSTTRGTTSSRGSNRRFQRGTWCRASGPRVTAREPGFGATRARDQPTNCAAGRCTTPPILSRTHCRGCGYLRWRRRILWPTLYLRRVPCPRLCGHAGMTRAVAPCRQAWPRENRLEIPAFLQAWPWHPAVCHRIWPHPTGQKGG